MIHPLRTFLWLACVLLAACGRHHDDKPATIAEAAHVGVVEQAPGATPFIARITLTLERYQDLSRVSFTVTPKPGTFSKPVTVSYDKAWLDRRNAWSGAGRRLSFPVFGLYAGYANDVSIQATFKDGSAHSEKLAIRTDPYTGQASVYGTPTIKTARGAGVSPGYDYIVVKNGIATPVVVDTDGNMRWVGTGLTESVSSLFVDDAFYVGSNSTPTLARVELNGTVSSRQLASTRFTNFHHDLSPGKNGFLAEMDVVDNGVRKVESVLAEIAATGDVLKEWDLGEIFRRTMRAGGDDPSNFVRDNADWFHMNSAIYDRADNSLLVSSRENFVVKLDYDTGNIRWILGDPAKHWYADYPSLRALALRVTSGKVPIGQHSLSILENGELLLFNNGTASLSQPPGTPPGTNRSYSAPSRYAIDEKARTAQEVWTYENDKTIYSDICSSVYQPAPGNYLIAYSVASGRTKAILKGVDAAGKVAFDIEYPTNVCAT
ncbi:MAG TPA: aryl-sulfate sulfotransferase, partial [Telluria sp.]|nr:aryl-sulfate sulfotransferase [Telluria sp.]